MNKIDELKSRLGEIQTRMSEINEEYAGASLPEEARSEFEALQEEKVETVRTIEECEVRAAWIAENADSDDPQRAERIGDGLQTQRPGTVRGEDIWDLSTIRSNAFSAPDSVEAEVRDRARRAIERVDYPHPGISKERAQEHVDRLVASNPEVARLVLTTGSPTYQRAFGKSLLKKPLTTDEQRALAISTNSGADGGLAVPFALDPTVIPTSDLSVNPYRAISRVETISGSNTWQGVTSDGVTAGYASEAQEASDDSPTFDQPEVKVERAQAFVPFSFEVGQDFANLQGQLAVMIQEAKDDLEADKFTNGSGVGEPQGILTGATVTVDSSTDNNVIAEADLYAVEEDLGPRFRARAVWVAPRKVYNQVRGIDNGQNSALWQRLAPAVSDNTLSPGRIQSLLIGYSAYESSTFPAIDSSDDAMAVFGDFSRYYLIVDRVGLSLSVIPHLFGNSNRPTGQSGLYAYWRNSAVVLSADAFRKLKV